MTDLPKGFRIRLARAGDHAALKDVCLKTGDSGADGTHLQDDPELLGLVYAVPYQVYAPDFAFVLEDAEGVCGYVLGAPDTAAFTRWMDRIWYPPLRARLRNPGADPAAWQQSDWVRWKVFEPPEPSPVDPALYPAHAHIDLLPRAQGRGLGRALMERELAALTEAGCAGVFLGVSPRNDRALAFYRHIGFQFEAAGPDVVILTRKLGGAAG